MPKIILTDRDGNTVPYEYKPRMTLMQAITEVAHIYDLPGLCGGLCCCGTCHVYIDEGFKPTLPPMSEDEACLLEYCKHPNISSRLSCQVRLDEKHDGMRVTIADER